MATVVDYCFSVEAHIGLIAACLPAFPGLFKDTKVVSSFKSWWASNTGSSSGSKSDDNDPVAFINRDVSLKDRS